MWRGAKEREREKERDQQQQHEVGSKGERERVTRFITPLFNGRFNIIALYIFY